MSEQPQTTDTAAMEEQIRTALRSVVDPELGMNVIELGLIRKLDILPDMTEITMLLTTPFCPYGPAMLEQVRRATEKATDKPARVTMAMEMWDPSMMEGGAPKEWGLW
jgi:metal-sulfur cluster biosynthetic enzyme